MLPRLVRRSDGGVILTFPYDMWVVDRLKAEVPAWCRTYDPTSRAWTVGPAYARRAEAILRERFGHVDVEDAAPPPRPIRETDPDYAVLHLLPSAPRELVA